MSVKVSAILFLILANIPPIITVDCTNDLQGLNWTFVLCYLYFCFCLELSPLVMNCHLTPNLYHLDAILAHLLIQNLTFSTNQGKI